MARPEEKKTLVERDLKGMEDYNFHTAKPQTERHQPEPQKHACNTYRDYIV
jgi:hypothetical protein